MPGAQSYDAPPVAHDSKFNEVGSGAPPYRCQYTYDPLGLLLCRELIEKGYVLSMPVSESSSCPREHTKNFEPWLPWLGSSLT